MSKYPLPKEGDVFTWDDGDVFLVIGEPRPAKPPNTHTIPVWVMNDSDSDTRDVYHWNTDWPMVSSRFVISMRRCTDEEWALYTAAQLMGLTEHH